MTGPTPTSVTSELERLIISGREGIALEFKSSMSWSSSATKAKVVKAALAMANNRDGGVIVFGVAAGDTPETPHVVAGMSEEEWRSFSQDDVLAKVNAHATPHIDLSVEHRRVQERPVVAIVIRPFVDYPVICSADLIENGRPVVVRGRIYCRSRRMAESTEMGAPDDMRDLIDLATAKGLERYVRLRAIEDGSTSPNARAHFDAELADLGL